MRRRQRGASAGRRGRAALLAAAVEICAVLSKSFSTSPFADLQSCRAAAGLRTARRHNTAGRLRHTARRQVDHGPRWTAVYQPQWPVTGVTAVRLVQLREAAPGKRARPRGAASGTRLAARKRAAVAWRCLSGDSESDEPQESGAGSSRRWRRRRAWPGRVAAPQGLAAAVAARARVCVRARGGG